MKINIIIWRKKEFILFIIFFLSIILTIISFLRPMQLEKEDVINKLEFKTLFDCMIDVKPCILYPDGGLVKPEGFISQKITNSIKLHIDSRVKSDKKVYVKGDKRIVITILADKLWEREFYSTEKESIEKTGDEIVIMDEDVEIDYLKIIENIKKVELEIDQRPQKYSIRIKPVIDIKGKLNGTEKYIDNNAEYKFDLLSNDLKKQSENLFASIIEFKTYTSVGGEFKIFNFKFNLFFTRMFCICLMIMMYIILFDKVNAQIRKRLNAFFVKKVFEIDSINNRFKYKIFELVNEINTNNHNKYRIASFEAIHYLSDEKEIPIFKFNNYNKKETSYFVIDGNNIYEYICENDKQIYIKRWNKK